MLGGCWGGGAVLGHALPPPPHLPQVSPSIPPMARCWDTFMPSPTHTTEKRDNLEDVLSSLTGSPWALSSAVVFTQAEAGDEKWDCAGERFGEANFLPGSFACFSACEESTHHACVFLKATVSSQPCGLDGFPGSSKHPQGAAKSGPDHVRICSWFFSCLRDLWFWGQK